MVSGVRSSSPISKASTGAPGAPSSTPSRIAVSQGELPALPVGAILDITIATDRNGQPGIVLNNNFFHAVLPEGLKPGDQVRVAVNRNTDIMVLQLLNGEDLAASVPSLPVQAHSLIDELLNVVLPQSSLEQLKRSKTLLEIPLVQLPEIPEPGAVADTASPETVHEAAAAHPKGRASAKESQGMPAASILPSVIEKQLAETLKNNREIADLLQRVASSKAVASPDELESPPLLLRILQNLTEPQVLPRLAPAQQNLERILQGRSEPALMKVAKALEERIETILGDKAELTFFAPSRTGEMPERGMEKAAAEALRTQLKLSVALSQYAISTQDHAFVATISKGLTLLENRSSPLAILLESLTGFKQLASPDLQDRDSDVVAALKTLVNDLGKLKDQKAPDQVIRPALARSLAALKGALTSMEADNGNWSMVEQSKQAIKTLELMLGGQESLNKVNPLMNALGEPALLIIPALIDGKLLRWQMSAHPARVEEDSEREKGDSEGYQRVELALSFPRLGAILVDIAHRRHELLLRVTSESKAVAAFISERLPKLEESLRDLGFTKLSLGSRQAEVRATEPSWYRDLQQVSVRA